MASHTQFPHPIAFVTLTPDEIAALNPVPWMTVADTQGNLTVWREGVWANVPLFTGTRHDGDILTWKTSQDIWVPSSNVNILGTLTGQRAYFTQDHTSALEVRRTWSTLIATKTGTGDMTPWGDHVLTANTSFVVVIDTAGSEQTATFKWSQDGGATYVQTLQPVTDLSRIALVSGVFIQFLEGSYDLADQWTWTAIGTANQLYDLQVDTTNSIVKVGTTMQFGNLADFKMYASAGNRYLQFATGFIVYNAPSGMGLQGTTTYLTLLTGESGISVGGFVELFNHAITPATPAIGATRFYPKADKPYWLDSGGIESIIPQAAKAETITGGWTFSAATTFSGVASLTAPILKDSGNNTRLTFSTSSPQSVFTGTVYAPALTDSAGTQRIAFLTVSPHIQLIGDVKLNSAPGNILDSGGTTRITLTAAGPYHVTLTGDINISSTMTAVGVYGTNLAVPNMYDAVGGTVRILLSAADPQITLTGNVKFSNYYAIPNIAIPASPGAGFLTGFSFAKATGAYQDTPRWLDSSTHDSGPVMRATSVIMHPVSITTAVVAAVISTILGKTGLCKLDSSITLHTISYSINAAAVGATGAVRLAIYTESGALITGTNVTDAPAAGVTGVRTVTLGSDVYLPAGNYYAFACIATAYGTTDPTILSLTTNTVFNTVSDVLCGSVVCTAGAAPSPLGTITSLINSTPYFKLGGAAT